jgi:hypothetical protein
MNVRHAIFGGVALICLAHPALAGPCATEIHDLQVEVNAKLDAIASQGKGAAQTTAATLHRQPTPDSLAAAEARAGDISDADVAHMRAFMAAAKKADDGGDVAACRKALSDARIAMRL